MRVIKVLLLVTIFIPLTLMVLPANSTQSTLNISNGWTCDEARTLGSAPSGYVVPFYNQKTISNGPGEGLHVNASSQAIDYVASPPQSFPIVAVVAGNVIDLDDTSDFGTVLRIEHDDGFISFYAHLDPDGIIANQSNQRVQRGEIIAYSGNSGSGGSGYHLHFEVREDWSSTDVYSGQSVNIRGLPNSFWCPWYPPGDSEKYSGFAYPPIVYLPIVLNQYNSLNEQFIFWQELPHVIHMLAFEDDGRPGQAEAVVTEGQPIILGFELCCQSIEDLQEGIDNFGYTLSINDGPAFSVKDSYQEPFIAESGVGSPAFWDHDGDGIGDGDNDGIGDWDGPIVFFRHQITGLEPGTHKFTFAATDEDSSYVWDEITVQIIP